MYKLVNGVPVEMTPEEIEELRKSELMPLPELTATIDDLENAILELADIVGGDANG